VKESRGQLINGTL